MKWRKMRIDPNTQMVYRYGNEKAPSYGDPILVSDGKKVWEDVFTQNNSGLPVLTKAENLHELFWVPMPLPPSDPEVQWD